MLENLKKEVLKANLKLCESGLASCTWGNVSAYDEKNGLIVIKPSGIEYEKLTSDMLVVLDLNGNVLEGSLLPSKDTATHLEIYKAFSGVKSVVHTHSPYAVARAQAKKSIPCYGTTHASYFKGAVLCTRPLTSAEAKENAELYTGKIIADAFSEKGIDPLSVPAVLAAFHGPFTWGKSVKEALINAEALEEIAKTALLTEQITSLGRV